MKTLSGPLAVAVLVMLAGPSFCIFTGAGADEGGAGGRAVVMIHNVDELQNMSKQGQADFELANDIDASVTRQWNSGAGFAPLGNYSAPLSGSLDGKGYNITDLYIYRPAQSMVGLFGLGESYGRNITLINVNITGGDIVGGLAGNNTMILSNCHVTGKVSGKGNVGGLGGEGANARMNNCSFYGTVTGTDWHVGGLLGLGIGTTVDCTSGGTVSGGNNVGGFVGYDWKGIISRCSSSASVKGTYNVGGFVGGATGNLSSCYSTGKVAGTDDVGGFVGNNSNENGNEGIISDCYSTGAVTGKNRVGGFAGSNNYYYPERPESWGATISRCYSAGAVSGETDAGAFLGKLSGGTVTDCYWDNMTSKTGSCAAGTGKSTSDMMKQATFTGWDFATVWKIDEGLTYPHLREAPAPPGNAAPSITTSPVMMAAAGKTYSVQYAATDADDDTLSWSLTTNATWLNMSGSGLLSGTPSASDLGTYGVAISVSDGKNGTDNQTFELTVSVNRAPKIASASGPSGTTVPANKALAFSVEATDPDGDSLTYEWQENGVTISTERSFSQRFAPGNHTLILLIGDGRYITTRTFNFTVAPPPKTIETKPAAIPGFEAGIAAAAVVTVVALGLFWRRERR